MNSRVNQLLVTGCYRSGTTVLEKLLHMHPELQIASQPFPLLYIYWKQRFLVKQGIARRYPLGHKFLERDYRLDSFYEFLEKNELTGSDVDAIFAALEGYTEGLWTPEMLRFRGQVKAGNFFDMYCSFNEIIKRLFPKEDARYVGGKEVLVEEYAPYLLTKGVAVILVVRDPRAMITSLNFRDRNNQTGVDRPLLFSLRAWRKSVAFALGLAGRPGFQWVRYEDLVLRPKEALLTLTRGLGVIDYPLSKLDEGIRDQYGNLWRGNSSFSDKDGLSKDSLFSFERRLPGSERLFIEKLCAPEMRALGYKPISAQPELDAYDIGLYRDPFPLIHSSFPKDYSWSPERVKQEEERLRLIRDRNELLSDEQAREWFVFPETYRRLRAA